MTGIKDRAIQAARNGKHRALLGRQGMQLLARARRDDMLRGLAAVRPYSFDLDRYRDEAGFFPFDFFLHHEAEDGSTTSNAGVPRVIYACWTGDNPMTANRVRCWEQFQAINPDVDHVLVTADNLADFVLPEHPLHPSYERLSAVHKSDYLRSYLLHFHGGGYTDIKEATAAWSPVFDVIDADARVWLVGYPEPSSSIADNLHGPLRRDLKLHYARLVGNGAFVVRPRTPLTAEWFAEVNRRVDYHSRDLERSPATDPWGTEGDYPITWVGLQGLVLHPLQLKYLDHVRQDLRLTPSFTNFR